MKKLFTVVAILLSFAIASVAGAAMLNYTFSEYPVGTIINNQYAGVTFSAGTVDGTLPIIANDGAMPGSPVLSPAGSGGYNGDMWMEFGLGINSISFDSGYWNSIGSGIIDLYNRSGGLIASLTNTALGVENFDLSGYGIIGKVYFNSIADPAGADIDNLKFNTVPEPATMFLLGTGLVGVAGAARRKKKNQA